MNNQSHGNPLFLQGRMADYLESSLFIDWRHPAIMELAAQLAATANSENQLAKISFEWVRDRVRHSWDYRLNPVTSKASEALTYRTGYCYAKSHLLAALLRANRIPAGLCYQRLSLEGGGPPYCLHGLNAVYLQDYGWYRIDPRGNKPGVNARFQPPEEYLAFALTEPNEQNFPAIYAAPLQAVVDALTRWSSVTDVYNHLPDVPVPPQE